jgi:hypothetical protein
MRPRVALGAARGFFVQVNEERMGRGFSLIWRIFRGCEWKFATACTL